MPGVNYSAGNRKGRGNAKEPHSPAFRSLMLSGKAERAPLGLAWLVVLAEGGSEQHRNDSCPLFRLMGYCEVQPCSPGAGKIRAGRL